MSAEELNKQKEEDIQNDVQDEKTAETTAAADEMPAGEAKEENSEEAQPVDRIEKQIG